MTTALRGTFVISGSQAEIDGIPAADVGTMVVGSIWRWQGEAVCVDAPRDLLQLGRAIGQGAVRRRAARSVRRILGPVVDTEIAPDNFDPESGTEGSFVVTDGQASFTASVIDLPERRDGLLVFSDRLPPADADLWVVETLLGDHGRPVPARLPRGITCFVSGTEIETPFGARAVEDLRCGDMVQTRDNGPQPVLWAGHTKMAGTRLADFADLRPIRISGRALGGGRDGDLLVSPDHKVICGGPEAVRLFGEDEVLVAARDLTGWPGVATDHSLDDLRYHHLMFETHEVILAGGMPCESFHPAEADLDGLLDAERLALVAVAPDIYRDSALYGGYARRNLTRAEAALLSYGCGV